MKMKSVKRLIAATLATVMTVGLAGCGGDTATGNDGSSVADSGNDATSVEAPSSEEEVSPYPVYTDADGNTYDLGGMEIIIRDWWSTDPEEPETAYEQAQRDYRDWIQETYNFTIKEQSISGWGDVPADFVNYAQTGGSENYVFCLRSDASNIEAMNNGLMYDLSKLDCLDFSESKWSNGVHNFYAKGSSIYGMRGIDAEPRDGMFFNKRLLTEAGVEPNDLYKWVEDGTWTWDKFTEVCDKVQRDIDSDGEIDVYGIATMTSFFYKNAVMSNGSDFITKDANGKLVSALESEATMEALNWAVETYDKYIGKYPEGSAWDYFYTAFINGEAAFLDDQAYNAGQKFKEMEDDFGFVPLPKGPKATDYNHITDDNLYVIPACYDDQKAWNIAFAYNLYTEPIPGFEDFAAWKNDYYQNFRDVESVDVTLVTMVNNSRVTYHGLVPGLSLNDDFIWGISADKTPAQKAEEIRDAWQALLDEANK